VSSYSQILLHVVFGTKGRERLLVREVRHELFPFMESVIREIGGTALALGGTLDHVHLLVRISAAHCAADLVNKIKANSSHWIHERWATRRRFAWQTGYAAFSVSPSNAPAVIRYIEDQENHHRKKSFREEYLSLLKKHGVAFDPQFVFED
jgi:REP element-mobilizing transposase RayT